MHRQRNRTQRCRLIFYFDGSHKNGAKLKYKHYKKTVNLQRGGQKGTICSLRQYKLTSWHTTENGGGGGGVKIWLQIKKKEGRSHVSIVISFITSHALKSQDSVAS